MTGDVKTRRYDASRRRAAADATRRAILDSAFGLFVERGYEATTMPLIAREAGVVVDTIYAVVGRKAALFRLLVESVISNSDQAVPALERDYVRALRASSSASEKLRLYAHAIASIHVRLAPLLLVVRGASSTTPDLANMWREISDRRAANMRLFAAELIATGQLRGGLGAEEVADIIWATNGPEFFALFVSERGWTPERFGDWLGASWVRLLLADRVGEAAGQSG